MKTMLLHAKMNIEFEPIIIDPLKDNFRCLGKLKKVIKDFDWED